MKLTFSRDTADMLEALDDGELAELVRDAIGYVFHDREPERVPDRLDVTWRILKQRIDRTRKPDEIRAAKMRAAKAAKRAGARKARA